MSQFELSEEFQTTVSKECLQTPQKQNTGYLRSLNTASLHTSHQVSPTSVDNWKSVETPVFATGRSLSSLKDKLDSLESRLSSEMASMRRLLGVKRREITVIKKTRALLAQDSNLENIRLGGTREQTGTPSKKKQKTE